MWRITYEILGVKGITSEFIGDTLYAFISIRVRSRIVTQSLINHPANQ